MRRRLYKLTVQVFGLAIVIRCCHAGPRAILTMRGEPHDSVGLSPRVVLPGRCAEAHAAPTSRGPPLAQQGGPLGPGACAPRRGQPCLLSLGDARLSAVVAPPPRAPLAWSPRQDPAGLDAGLLGCSDRARCHRP